MKRILFWSVAFILLLATCGHAAPKNSAALDAHLSDVDNDALQNMDRFMMRMNQVYGVTRSVVESMMHTHRFSPGDVYMTCWLSQLSGKPPVYVADYYSANRGKGWGVIAKKLGIKPGSPEFHALKRGDGPFKIIDGPGQGKGKKKKKRED